MTNVVLITTDQQRADSIGAYGNPVCETPRLDEFAAAGTRFDLCHTQNPYCQPARATILLGQYPSTHGVTSNGIDLDADSVARTVATRFVDAGHRTGFFGKAHFASTYPVYPTGAIESVDGSAMVPEDWTGPYFGFEDVQLMLFGHSMRTSPLMGQWNWIWGPPPFGLHYARWLFRDGHAKGVERLRQMQPEGAGAVWDHTQTWASALSEEDHPTTWTADRAIEWLGERAAADEPFFTWISFSDPHHPMDAPAPWSTKYTAADVTEMLPERREGDLDGKPAIHKLWSHGARGGPFEWANPGGSSLTDPELAKMIAGYYGMVSMLDHHIGRVLDEIDRLGLAEDTVVIVSCDHGEWLGDHGLIFKGPIHYEGLLRVPLIVRGPGFEAGSVVADPVGTIDLAPTMLGAAGITVPDDMQGRPLLDGAQEYVLTENDHQMVLDIPLRTITTDRWKLTRYEAMAGVGELYDLTDDPGEFDNRWDDPACAGVQRDLLALLDEVMNHDPVHGEMVGLVA